VKVLVVLAPYRSLLATPGSRAFTAAGFVARLPMSMLNIGIVLLVEAATGSYAIAGAVAATFAVVQAAASPQLARLVDRLGQARVTLPMLAVHLAGLVALILLAQLGAPSWTLFAAAAIAGVATPQIGSLVRARWAYLVSGTPRLHTAYSFESVVDELIFIVGPVLVTILATGVGAAMIFVGAGTLLFALQRGTEPEPSGRPRGNAGSAIAVPAIRVLALAFVALGAIFGSVDVATVAFADEAGHPAAAGLVLAVFAVGSMISGLAYGAVRWRSSLRRRFLVTVVALAVSAMLLVLVPSIPLLVPFAFVVGLSISPTIVAAMGLVESLVPARQLTEGLTWATTGVGFGIAIGSSLAGRVVEASGARAGFAVTLGAGLATALIALAGSRWLRPPLKAAVTSSGAPAVQAAQNTPGQDGSRPERPAAAALAESPG
jgi:MFS family permease